MQIVTALHRRTCVTSIQITAGITSHANEYRVRKPIPRITPTPAARQAGFQKAGTTPGANSAPVSSNRVNISANKITKTTRKGVGRPLLLNRHIISVPA